MSPTQPSPTAATVEVADADRTTDLDAQLCFALYAANNAIARAYRPLLDRLGITYTQYLVLLVLWHEGSRTHGELAARLHLVSHAITPLVDRLIAGGFVVRRRDRNDRRVVHVALTDLGRALEPEAAEIQRQVGCALASTDDEVAQLRGSVQELVRRITATEAAALEDAGV